MKLILNCVLKDTAFKNGNDVISDNYELYIISNKSEDEKLKSSNILLEAIVLSELFKANLSNSEWLNKNLKDEYKKSEQGSQYFEIFRNVFRYIGLFKQKYSQTAFDNDTKDVFEKVKSMLSETLTFNGIEKENSLSSSDIENSDSSTVSAPQTPEKNGNDVKVEIKVDGSEEQDEDERKLIEEEKEAEKNEVEEYKVEEFEEEAMNIEEDKEAEKDETKDNLGKEKAEKPTKENQGEVKSEETTEDNKDAQSEREGLFWNVFGAISSGIELGGSIEAGATIVLGVGALAVLSGVGLILAGAAAATVGLVSLGTFIYNLVKIHKKRKLQNETKKENNDEGKETEYQEISIEVDKNENSIQNENEANKKPETDKQQTIIPSSTSENGDGNLVPLQESVGNPNKGKDDSL